MTGTKWAHILKKLSGKKGMSIHLLQTELKDHSLT